MLSLTHEGHLLIQRNDVILENIFLPFGATATTSLKVLKNNDVLVFMHSHLGEARIFRVQVKLAKMCLNCRQRGVVVRSVVVTTVMTARLMVLPPLLRLV